MKNKKDYITILSVISAFAVVFLHTNGCFWNFSKERYWITANIIECVFYFAVPVFFMITGANLIDYQKKYSTKVYFKKRLFKTVIPFIIWLIIGTIYLVLTKQLLIKDINVNYIFNIVFNVPNIYIYWFFLHLFAVYLCIPLFASVEESKRKTVFSYLVLAGFIINSLIPFIIQIFNFKVTYSLTLLVSSNYLLYVLAGYLLDKYELSKKWKVSIYILCIVGLLSHIIGTRVLSYEANTVIQTYKGYLNVPCILYSIGIFVLVKDICKKIKNYKIMDFLGKYTFAIYLMHWYILDISCHLLNIDIRSIYYRICAPFVIVALCILITFLIRKIPIIKKILP